MSLTQKPESGLKLADVVEFDPVAQPWNKLGGVNRFSKFHAKFWGKSMVDEEREWLNSTDDDDVVMDDGYDEDTDDTDADGELIPGCYELDISPNPVSDVSKIWIRADYIRVYKYTESKYGLCYERRRAQAVVLTGHPGIGECVCLYPQVTLLIVNEGKSVCLLYMLRRRCAEKKPVIWYDGIVGYIFVDDGVYKVAPDFHVNEFKIFVWTLVDADQAQDGVPPELVRNRTRLFVFYASPPNSERWKRLHKTVDDITLFMNPWTWREMLRACVYSTLRYSSS